jgi:hypothetical protein
LTARLYCGHNKGVSSEQDHRKENKMSRQQKRHAERRETVTDNRLYDYIFAEVAAWEEGRWTLSHDEDTYAEAITAQLSGMLTTGYTRAERRDLVRKSVAWFMGDVENGEPEPSAILRCDRGDIAACAP